MPAVSKKKKLIKVGGITFTEVSKGRVQKVLVQFKTRIEDDRKRGAPFYSVPSDKTRIRILE